MSGTQTAQHLDISAVSRTGDDTAAIAAYGRLADQSSLDARTLTNWGNALTRTRRPEQAIERYRDALKIDPGYANAHYNLALSLERTGNPVEALSVVQSALDRAGILVAADIEELTPASRDQVRELWTRFEVLRSTQKGGE